MLHLWRSFLSRVTDRLPASKLMTEEPLLSRAFNLMGMSVHLLPPPVLSRPRNISQIVRNLILPMESTDREKESRACVQ